MTVACGAIELILKYCSKNLVPYNTDMTDLTSKKCEPCEGGIPALSPEQVQTYIVETPEWFADNSVTTIARTFHFNDFQDAILFVNKVAQLSEREGHHPNLFVHNYNKVTISLTTHAIGGLSENDFILAAKIDELL